jgi:hypothetical protein
MSCVTSGFGNTYQSVNKDPCLCITKQLLHKYIVSNSPKSKCIHTFEYANL